MATILTLSPSFMAEALRKSGNEHGARVGVTQTGGLVAYTQSYQLPEGVQPEDVTRMGERDDSIVVGVARGDTGFEIIDQRGQATEHHAGLAFKAQAVRRAAHGQVVPQAANSQTFNPKLALKIA